MIEKEINSINSDNAIGPFADFATPSQQTKVNLDSDGAVFCPTTRFHAARSWAESDMSSI
jgi:hypothetical protein